MNPRSAVETAVATHYIAGLHFWTRTLNTYVSVICSNALGAVEYRIHTDTGEGTNVLHSPDLVRGWADDVTLGCPVQGGRCYEGHSTQAFRELLLPLLEADDFPGVLNKLAEIHGGYFRTGVAA